jgi:hypothetical protein
MSRERRAMKYMAILEDDENPDATVEPESAPGR